MVDILPHRPRKGRGAIGNPAGRFEPETRHAIDDGWTPEDQANRPRLETEVTVEHPKTIIARNTSPDVPFDRSINPYRGCEHGCVYCFARPSHAYHGLSPGLDFESRLFVKPAAAALLEHELSNSNYRCATLALGSNTDPYQPIERHWRITRAVLGVLSRHNHPVAVVTKSNLVLRDLDILGPMAERGLAAVALSITTLDRDLARRMEPRAPTPERRLDAVRRLSAAGVPTAVLAAPLIPALTDMEAERILEAAADAGARAADYILLRLPRETAGLFAEWLDEHAPMKADHVMSLTRAARNGALNASEWGRRKKGSGAYADMLAERVALARRRLGLDRCRFDLRADLFRPPPRVGDQLALF